MDVDAKKTQWTTFLAFKDVSVLSVSTSVWTDFRTNNTDESALQFSTKSFSTCLMSSRRASFLRVAFPTTATLSWKFLMLFMMASIFGRDMRWSVVVGERGEWLVGEGDGEGEKLDLLRMVVLGGSLTTGSCSLVCCFRKGRRFGAGWSSGGCSTGRLSGGSWTW